MCQQRTTYTEEQNQFIIKFFEGNNWKDLSRAFNERFPERKREPKQIKNYYKHSLDPTINKDSFTEEERKQLMNYVEKYVRKWRKIGELMNREENKNKNEYLRHISPKFVICNEILKNQKYNFDCISYSNAYNIILDDFDISF
jgi:hypothetical protein